MTFSTPPSADSRSAGEPDEADEPGPSRPASVFDSAIRALGSVDRSSNLRAAASIGSAEAQAPLAQTSGDARWFTSAYVIACLVGVVPVFLSHDAWLFPILSLLVYIVMGHGKAVRDGSVFEFADSAYYLGFTLSIGSLLASTEPFQTVGHPDPDKIFHYFGLGLMTTLIGVVARTALQTYHRLPTENFESINRRVTEQAERYVERLAELNAGVDQVLQRTTAHLAEGVTPKLQQVEAALDTTLSELARAAEAATILKVTAGTAGGALDALVVGYNESASKLTTAHGTLTQSAEKLAEQFVASGQAGTTLASGLGSVQEGATKAVSALGSLTSQLDAITIDPTPLASPIAEAGRALRMAAAAATSETTLLHETVGRFVRDVEAVNEASLAIQDPTLQRSLTTLQSEIAVLATAVKAQGQLVTTDVTSLRETTNAALQATRALAATLEEIAHAELVRLSSVGESVPSPELVAHDKEPAEVGDHGLAPGTPSA